MQKRTAASPGSSAIARRLHGIDSAILETGVGRAGTVLEADLHEARWRRPDVRNAAFGAGTVEPSAPGGRENDFGDAERLVKRLVARELVLSFVPDPEQRLWRTVTPTKYQLTRNRVQLQNRLEALLEEAHIKLPSLVSDLLGVSARRMLHALAAGETDPAALATLADGRLRATPEQLCDVLGACQEMNSTYRRLLKMALEELDMMEKQIGQLDQEMADLLGPHQNKF